MQKRETICLLHKLLSQLPIHYSPLLQELPSDGVYFYYEQGESIRCAHETFERIVRVGSHRKMGGLPRRLIDHYWANKDGSVFRKHIGSALIRRNGKPEDCLRSWIAKGQPYDLTLENEVDSSLRTRFKFRTLLVPQGSERDSLERNLIAFLSEADVSAPSETWLGRFSPYPEIRKSGLWNVHHVEEAPEVTPEALLARIEELVVVSLKSYTEMKEAASPWQWRYINQALQKIEEDRIDQSFRIGSLELLFHETQDGWVALHLARTLRVTDQLDRALDYAAQAEKLLPIPSRKVEARQEIDRIEASLTSGERQRPELLIVVGCSPEKIWDVQKNAKPYVPAQDAYVGDYFRQWIQNDMRHPKLAHRSWRWIILSGKYGFIEPEHPICNYDTNLLNPSQGPISNESLKGQAYKQLRWSGALRLCDFTEIVVHASSGYVQKVREIFPNKPVRSWKDFVSNRD
jgi:hypothetical protein